MKYTAKILGIGAQACGFRDENMLIFFGQCAGGGLEDYSVLIREPEETVSICPGIFGQSGNSAIQSLLWEIWHQKHFQSWDTAQSVLMRPEKRPFPALYMWKVNTRTAGLEMR